MTLAELYAGKSIWEDRNAKEALETVLSGIEIVSLTQDIAIRSGELRAQYNIDLIDAIIAASCIVQNMELVTLNIKHFKDIKNLSLLKAS